VGLYVNFYSIMLVNVIQISQRSLKLFTIMKLQYIKGLPLFVTMIKFQPNETQKGFATEVIISNLRLQLVLQSPNRVALEAVLYYNAVLLIRIYSWNLTKE
jgi:hypothetical protein